MYYDLESENRKAKMFVKDASRAFKPGDAVVVDTLEEGSQHATGKHYTFSCLVPDTLRRKIEPVTRHLGAIDPSLMLNEPELYHLTVFWCDLDQDVDRLVSIFKKHLSEEALAFDLSGLAVLPFGISLKAYPLNTRFFALRHDLWEATHQAIPLNPDGSIHEQATSTWITLGRYTQPPTDQLIDYVRGNLDLEYGHFVPEQLGAYLSDNKYLRNPKTIEIIKNGQD